MRVKTKRSDNSSFFKALYNLQKISQIVVQKSFGKDFYFIFEISKKQEKLIIFQMNIHPAMSDYYKSYTECYKVVEERKVLCTLLMQTTSGTD